MFLKVTVAILLVGSIAAYDFGLGNLFARKRAAVNRVCYQHPLDIVFILDASASIWAQNFTKAKQFVNNFIEPYEIGPAKVRVSLETYADKVYESDIIHFVDFTDGPSLRNHIENIKWHHGSRTETGLGISYMRTNIMSQARSNVPNICIVITDGNSQEPEKTAAEAKRARDQGIEMFAIGVSEDVSREELENIAGDPDRVIIVKTYSELEAIKEKLSGKTCKDVPTPPPTQPADQCGVNTPTDVYFVMDPAYLGFERVNFATSFVRKVIQFEEFRHIRVGMISGSCPLDSGFNLNRYRSYQQVRRRLDAYDRNSLPRLVGSLTSAYISSNGGRENAKKVAVIFIGGKVDPISVIKNAQAAQEIGVEIYFADAGNAEPDLLNALAEIGFNLASGNSGLTAQASLFVQQLCQ